jgi:hypothetical protein
MTENEFTLSSKTAIVLLVLWIVIGAALNIQRGEVRHPLAFVAVIVGFVLFAATKLCVIAGGKRISFGTSRMTEGMANAYRVGYWLMIVGTLVTFFRHCECLTRRLSRRRDSVVDWPASRLAAQRHRVSQYEDTLCRSPSLNVWTN